MLVGFIVQAGMISQQLPKREVGKSMKLVGQFNFKKDCTAAFPGCFSSFSFSFLSAFCARRFSNLFVNRTRLGSALRLDLASSASDVGVVSE